MKKLFYKVRDMLTGQNLTRYAGIAVQVTTRLLTAGSNPTVQAILSGIGLQDEAARVRAVLNRLLPEFTLMQSREGRLAIAKRIGVEIIQALDGGKSGKMKIYSDIFEEILEKALKGLK